MLEWFEMISQIAAVDLAGLSAVSLFAVLFFGTFVSEDAACIAAGALAANGDISLAFAIGSCFTGIVAGDLSLYWVGRLFGRNITRSRLFIRFVPESSLSRGAAWMERRGAAAVFLSRFVSGLRLPTYLAAGFLKTSFPKFALYFVLAASIWTPVVVGSVALSSGSSGVHVIAVAIGAFVLLRIVMKLASWRSRRLLVGRLRRFYEWEFWPLPVFYLPVAVYILMLGIRYRSITLFTCANPSLPGGGFVGESKDEIYSLIASADEDREFSLRHCVVRTDVSADERLRVANEFLGTDSINFPVVLKPDAGERGKGVRILRTLAELEAAVTDLTRDHILQEFYPGDEVSVFYYRHPEEVRGKIFSVTQKIFPTVLGDGQTDVETLILRDHRAVCLAEKYFAENVEALNSVPDANEEMPIIRIGTHSRGAIFLDGSHLISAEFENAIDALCRRIDGFNFGRFDIRYSSLDEFRSGRGFKIIELNGVTSESTNIYDPQYSLIDAYRILFRQWRIAFEIGAANKLAGISETPVRTLFSAIISSFA